MSTTDGQPQGQANPPGPTYGIPPQGQPLSSPFDAPPPAAPGAGTLPTPAAPPAGRKRTSGLVSIIVLILVGAGIYGVSWFTHRNDISKAATGDCATFDEGADNPFTKADCSDNAATYVVLQKVDSSRDCMDVAGAERSLSVGDDYLCFGIKGVDPQTSINVAKVGDCVNVVGDDAKRTPCSASDATHKVLKRATNVSKVPGTPDPCDGADETDSEYGWSWRSDDGPDLSGLRTDVVLCLAEL